MPFPVFRIGPYDELSHSAKWYEQKTNVHVTYTYVPQSGARESANLLMAAGDYPDVMMSCGFSSADAMSYGSQGIFIPLNELIDKHAYWLREAYKKAPELPAAMVGPDGNIYGFPDINQAFHTFYNQKAWINEEWLKKLGLNAPATTDQFYEVLKAFKTGDPNGNGKADEIAMMGANGAPRLYPWVFLLNSFVYFNPGNYLELNNGKVGFVAAGEDYREGLRYIARLVSEGLLDPASFTQTSDQAKLLGTNPAAPLIGVFTDFVWWNFVGQYIDTADQRANKYAALAPLKGPKGVQYTPAASTGFRLDLAQITDHCKDPVLAARWLDGLFNEEVTMAMQFGVKETWWTDPAPGAKGINQKPALYKVLDPFPGVTETGRAANIFIGNRYSDLRLGEEVDYSNPMALFEMEPRLYRETQDKYYPFRPPEGKYLPLVLHHTDQENSETARLAEQINTYTLENLVAFITGNKNLDRDWTTYLAEFQKLNLTRYLQLKQIAYDRQYGKK